MIKKTFACLILIILAASLTACWRSVKYHKPAVSAAHHGEDSFISSAQKKSPMWSYLKMRFKEGSMPEVLENDVKQLVQPVDMDKIESPDKSPQITWIGHATALVQYQGINFLTDPHFTDYASPLPMMGPKRLAPPAPSLAQLPAIDFIIISHNHYDHLDHATVKKIGNSSHWMVPLGLKQWLMKRDIDAENITELDWWQTHHFSEQVEITATPAQHWSKRTPFDTNKSLWSSWHININGFKTWFGGDTGYNHEVFKRIGDDYGPHDLALIPIGAYAPRYFMSPQHIDPTEALLAHQDVDSRFSVGIHWGTFQLTHEPYLEPQRLLKSLVLENPPSHPFVTLKVGQTEVIKIP